MRSNTERVEGHAIGAVSLSVVELAGGYVDTVALRGYDRVQLATAHTLPETGSEPLAPGSG